MEIPEGPPSYADPRERKAIEAAQEAVYNYAAFNDEMNTRCLIGSVRISEAAYIAIAHYKKALTDN